MAVAGRPLETAVHREKQTYHNHYILPLHQAKYLTAGAQAGEVFTGEERRAARLVPGVDAGVRQELHDVHVALGCGHEQRGLAVLCPCVHKLDENARSGCSRRHDENFKYGKER